MFTALVLLNKPETRRIPGGQEHSATPTARSGR
jgi:hypothetical protein